MCQRSVYSSWVERCDGPKAQWTGSTPISASHVGTDGDPTQASHSSIIHHSSSLTCAHVCVFVHSVLWGEVTLRRLAVKRSRMPKLSCKIPGQLCFQLFSRPRKNWAAAPKLCTSESRGASACQKKRRISNKLGRMQKGGVLVKPMTRWWMPCVSCDCSERWGEWTWRSVADACHSSYTSLSGLSLSLSLSEAVEERKCRCVVSVRTDHPSLSFSLSASLPCSDFSEYGEPRAKTLKPSALLRLPPLSAFASSFSSSSFALRSLSSAAYPLNPTPPTLSSALPSVNCALFRFVQSSLTLNSKHAHEFLCLLA